MSSSRWSIFDHCGACGVAKCIACRTAADEVATRPCPGRRLLGAAAKAKRQEREKQKRADTAALVAICVREMKALTAQHERVMALLVSIKQKQSPQKEGQ
jgi:hypothetical protein